MGMGTGRSSGLPYACGGGLRLRMGVRWGAVRTRGLSPSGGVGGLKFLTRLELVSPVGLVSNVSLHAHKGGQLALIAHHV